VTAVIAATLIRVLQTRMVAQCKMVINNSHKIISNRQQRIKTITKIKEETTTPLNSSNTGTRIRTRTRTAIITDKIKTKDSIMGIIRTNISKEMEVGTVRIN
jgi:ethanolamine ammonia-lyase small subunit